MDVPRYHTALIVGAGPGLSASLARLCADAGMNVALAARNTEKLAELCADTNASAYACDARDAYAVAGLFDQVEARQGTPDLVVYNAAARVPGPVTDLDPGAVRLALEVSAFGAFLVAQQAAQGARRHRVHRRHRRRQGVRQFVMLRHGQVRPARAGSVAGA